MYFIQYKYWFGFYYLRVNFYHDISKRKEYYQIVSEDFTKMDARKSKEKDK